MAEIQRYRNPHLSSDENSVQKSKDGPYVLCADHLAALAEKDAEHTRELARYGSLEEKAHLQTIDERDAAEQALSQAYFLIIGSSPEWSNLFGHNEAIEEIDDAQRCLRAEIASLEKQNAALQQQVVGSVLIWILGLLISLSAGWAVVYPGRPIQPLSSTVISSRFPYEAEWGAVRISENILIEQQSARLKEYLSSAELFNDFFGNGKKIGSRSDIFKFYSEACQAEPVQLFPFIDDLGKLLNKAIDMFPFLWIRDDLHCSGSSNIESLRRPDILNEEAHPQWTLILQNAFRRSNLRVFHAPNCQSCTSLIFHEPNLSICSIGAFLSRHGGRQSDSSSFRTGAACFVGLSFHKVGLPLDGLQGFVYEPSGYSSDSHKKPVWDVCRGRQFAPWILGRFLGGLLLIICAMLAIDCNNWFGKIGGILFVLGFVVLAAPVPWDLGPCPASQSQNQQTEHRQAFQHNTQVDERLPLERELVLARLEEGSLLLSSWFKWETMPEPLWQGFVPRSGDIEHYVTYWQPLPSPPVAALEGK